MTVNSINISYNFVNQESYKGLLEVISITHVIRLSKKLSVCRYIPAISDENESI